jgi:hypothetical protein
LVQNISPNKFKIKDDEEHETSSKEMFAHSSCPSSVSSPVTVIVISSPHLTVK